MRRTSLLSFAISAWFCACAPAPDAETAIAAAQSRYSAALASGDAPAAAAQAAADALAASPAFQDTAAEDDGTAWAEYQGGGRFMIVYADGDGPGDLPAVDVSGGDVSSQSSALSVFDPSASFQIFNTFDQASWHSGAFIDHLRAKLIDRGFHDVSTPFTTTALRGAYYTNGQKPTQLAGSLLYFSTHGGKNGPRATDPDEYYALWTSESAANFEWTKDVNPRAGNPYFGQLTATNPYHTDFNQHLIVEMAACSKKDCSEKRWGITNKFIAKYLKVEPNSVIYADACATLNHDSTAMSTAFQTAGAGAYLGWTDNVVYANGVAAMYALTGLWLSTDYASDLANDMAAEGRSFVAPPMLQLPPDLNKRPRPLPPSPPYPPMDLSTAYSYLALVPAFPSVGTAHLGSRMFVPNAPQLAPSLTSIGALGGGDNPLTNNGATLMPFGSFPTKDANAQLAVTVGGTMANCAWKMAPAVTGGGFYFQCTIPNNAAGDVVMTMNGAKSNAIPLTEWRGTLTDAAAPNSDCPATITANLHMRADVHQTRVYDSVHGDFPPAVPSDRTVFVVPDSTVTVVFGGNCAGTVAVPYWDQTMPQPAQGADFFSWTLTWNASAKRFTSGLSVSATATYTDPTTNLQMPMQESYGPPGILMVDPTDWSIKAGSSAGSDGSKSSWQKISPTPNTQPNANTAS